VKLDARGSLLVTILALMGAIGATLRAVPAAPAEKASYRPESPASPSDEEGSSISRTARAPTAAASAVATSTAPATNAGPPETTVTDETEDSKFVSETQAACECHFYQALLRSFGDPSHHPSCAPDEVARGTSPNRTAFEKATASFPPKVLIATIPDPIDSGLADLYDGAIEAIDMSLERLDYTHDQFWVPWKEVQGADAQTRCRFRVPGVVVHHAQKRELPDRDRDIVTLLVGEAPTWGVHKPALTFALEFWRQTPQPSKEVPILGPSFTGSASSLHETLDRWWHRRGRADPPTSRGKPAEAAALFDVVTGSATNVLEEDVLGRGAARLPGRMRMTVSLQRELECAFYGYLHEAQGVALDNGHVVRGTAVLVESATAFGGVSSKLTSPGYSGPSPCGYFPELVLNFPLHISRVRSAYASAETPNDVEVGQIRIPNAELRPDLAERSPPRDIAPSLSDRMTVIHDTELATLFADLSQHDTQYVGAIATDAADVVFLVDQIHKVLPNSRVFLFNANALYEHPHFFPAFYGSYVVSPYPLTGRRHFGHSRLHRAFPSESAEGIFNAVEWLESSGSKLPEPGWLQIDPLSGSPKPPIWIASIGMGGIRPVALASGGKIHLANARFQVPRDVNPPRSWTLLVVAVAVSAWVAARAYLRALAPPPVEGGVWRDLQRPMAASIISMPPMDGATAEADETAPPTFRRRDRLGVESNFYRLVTIVVPATALVLVGCVTVLAWTSCWPLGARQIGTFTVELVVLLAAMTQVVPALSSAIRAWFWSSSARAGDDDRRSGGWRSGLSVGIPWYVPTHARIFTFLGALLLQLPFDPIAALGLGAISAWRLSYASYQLFVARLTDVTSGLSPMTMFIFASAFFWTWGRSNLGRVATCRDIETDTGPERLRVAVALACSKRGEEPTPLARAEAQMLVEIHDPVHSHTYQLTLVITIVAALSLLVMEPPTSLETRWPHVAIVLAVSLLMILAISTMTHCTLLLMSVSGLLKRVARHPIASALGRVPAQLRRKAGDRIAEYRDHAAELEIALGLLEGLKPCPLPSSDKIAPEAAPIRANLDQAFVSFDRDTSRRRELIRRVLTDLVHAAGSISKALWPLWSASPGTPEARTQGQIEGLVAWKRAAEQYVASVVVILIGRVLGLFRYFMIAGTVGGLALLLLVSTYPLHPHRLLATAAGVLTLAAVSLNLSVLVSLERDEVVSRIAHTTIGKVNLTSDVISRLVVLVIVPALSVIALQFPRAAATLVGWMDPVLRAFR